MAHLVALTGLLWLPRKPFIHIAKSVAKIGWGMAKLRRIANGYPIGGLLQTHKE